MTQTAALPETLLLLGQQQTTAENFKNICSNHHNPKSQQAIPLLVSKKGPKFCSSLLYVLGELPLATGESQENKQPPSAGSSYNRKIIISQLEKP